MHKCEQAAALWHLMNAFHYHPLPLNNELSRRTYHNFLEISDPWGFYLLPQDLEELSSFQFKLDEEISNKSCTFTSKMALLFKERISQADSLVNSILNQNFDFQRKETLFINYSKKTKTKQNSKETHYEKWRKYLKHSIIRQIYSDLDDSTANTIKYAEFYKKIPDAKDKIRTRINCSLEKKANPKEGLPQIMHSIFMESIALSYDPNSSYFTQDDNDWFISSLSQEGESFGLSFVQNQEEEIEIASLTPGGAAWKSNALAEGDLVKRVILDDSIQPDLNCTDAFQLNSKIEASSIKKMKITVKNTSGKHITIELKKSKSKIEFNTLKSFLLNGKNKIAYMAIPSFYFGGKNSNSKGLADDVAREIARLNKEKVEGLILDLRNNGGGSVEEAMDFAGIFINEGPLSIWKYNGGIPEVWKDKNKGKAFDKPITVLVNGFSASASEIFASTLQCYNRAIIVGSPTHGKSSSQIIVPLDTNILHNMALFKEKTSENGFLKVTMEKIYKINGGSFQGDGLQPDIILPDLWESYYERESSLNYALKRDTLYKTFYYNPEPQFDKERLIKKSKDRILMKEEFKYITQKLDSLSTENVNKVKVPLDFEGYWEMKQQEKNKEQVEQKILLNPSEEYIVKNNAYVQKLIPSDPILAKTNKTIMKDIQEDIFIEECYFILQDMLMP